MPRKIKVQRKDVTEPDEFISTTSRATVYVRNNYRVLIPVAGAVLVLVLITVIWSYYRAGRERSAREVFNQAVALYQTEGRGKAEQPSDQTYREALTRFTALADSYGSTTAGMAALFYLGESSYHLRDYDKAIEYYNRFISRSRPGSYLRCFAYEGLGYCYEEKQDYAKAVDFYKRALAEPSPAVPDLLYGAVARCYDALNDKANALEYYKKIATDARGSMLLTIAGDRLRALSP
jgi:tetratricopeptide (TPR) repeat protein